MRRVDYRKSLFVGACCVAAFAQSAPLQAPQAQDWEKAAGGKKAFDVASVKLDQGPFRPSNFPFVVKDDDATRPVGDRLSADYPVFTYITFAYKVGLRFAIGNGAGPEEIRKAMQMPEWVMRDRYAIEARADVVSTKDQMRLMMQSLLAERFGFKAHFEERTFPAFALVLAHPGRTGPKLRPHSEGVPCDEKPAKIDFSKLFPPACGSLGYFMMPNRVEKAGARNITLAEAAEGLPGIGGIDRPMVDRTGLEGSYDLTIEFAPEPNGGSPPASDAAADLPGPTFIEALTEQLGLKLELVKANIRILVIDHIERPSGN
jgi:uncharacterized protein (TIGR03435 family)